MVDLIDYLERAEDADKRLRLKVQWETAVGYDHTILCSCGLVRAIEKAYRCLYCGEWYCAACAEVHFGQTVEEWVREKRKAGRIEEVT